MTSILLSWGTVPYWISLGIAVVFAVLQLTGILGLFVSSEIDSDADVDVDADADVDADGDAETDADGDSDGDDDGDNDHAATWAHDLGLGRVPLSVVWQSFAIAFGVTGIAVQVLLSSFGPFVRGALALPIALIAGYAFTRALTSILVRIVSDRGQEATTRGELVGQIGVVISSRVDREFGEVRLLDRSGHALRLVCTSDGAVIPEGREVIVIEAGAGRPVVHPLEDPPSAP